MSSPLLLDFIQQAAQILKISRHAVAFTGAGISTPSGIPDFRSQGTGLWNSFDPMRVASLTAFRSHPEDFFNWLRPLAQKMLQAVPNPAHIALAELQKAGLIKAIITQNIDNLHQQAGAFRVIQVHGSMDSLICLKCKQSYLLSEFITSFIDQEQIPLCPTCNKALKPTITLFEEMLPETAWSDAERECYLSDVMLVLGSSLEVVPACYLPRMAVENGARLIINNLTPTPLDGAADLLLQCDLAESMPQIALYAI